MKILVLNYEYPPLGGGGAPVCKALSELYARRGHDVRVVTMGFRGLPESERRAGVVIERVPAWRKKQETCETLEMISYVMSAMPKVISLLQRQKFDVIHSHFIVPTGLLTYLATRFCRVPYLLTIHGTDVPGYNTDRFQLEHAVTPPLLRIILNHADQIIAPSKYLSELVREKLGSFDIAHLPNGINTSLFANRPKQRRILMTGRLLQRKGFQHVLKALQGLDTEFEVHVAGDGPMRPELERLAADVKSKVVFHGWLDHHSPLLKQLYETSSIFCMPSERENSSISLLEALLSGMAVITSDVSGCPETVGDAGFVVPPRDPGAIRKVLKQLIERDDIRQEFGFRARQRVERFFDWEKIGAEYLEHLQAIAK